MMLDRYYVYSDLGRGLNILYPFIDMFVKYLTFSNETKLQ